MVNYWSKELHLGLAKSIYCMNSSTPGGMAEIEERQLTWHKVKCTAQNRVRWQAIVDDLCSTRNGKD